MTAAEVHDMGRWDRMLTARARIRFWQWWGKNMLGDGGGGGKP